MKESTAVRDAMHRFFDRLSANDVSAFYDLVEVGDATLVLGTAPGEIVRDEERLRFGFEFEGLTMKPGEEHGAWEEGTVGCYVGEPIITLPNGTKQSWRMTTVWHRSGDTWKLVHMHASVGVPDEEVADLQARWGTAPS